jgi:putative cell wall-binding protein
VAAEEGETEAPETEAPETEPTEPVKPEEPKVVVKNIYIIGGESAVSADLRTAINAATGLKASRISGENRYETSVKIAEAFFTKPTHIVLAYGQNFPDGLSGGILASCLKAPLILTRDISKSYAVEYAVDGGVKMGVVLGGPTLIADETVKEIFGLLETDKIAVK